MAGQARPDAVLELLGGALAICKTGDVHLALHGRVVSGKRHMAVLQALLTCAAAKGRTVVLEGGMMELSSRGGVLTVRRLPDGCSPSVCILDPYLLVSHASSSPRPLPDVCCTAVRRSAAALWCCGT